MQLLFLYPPAPDEKVPLHPPIEIAQLAAQVQEYGHSISIFDLNVYRPTMDSLRLDIGRKVEKWDLIFIFARSNQFGYVKELLTFVRRLQGQATIIGFGPLFSCINQKILEFLPQLDLAFSGDGDLIILDIIEKAENTGWPSIKGLEYRENGELKSTGPREPIKAPDDLPYPAYNLLELGAYFQNSALPLGISASVSRRRLNIKLQRGTATNPVFPSAEYAAKLLAKLRLRYAVDHFKFLDKNICSDSKYLYELCDAVEKADLIGTCTFSLRADIQKLDSELFRRLKDVGIDHISYEIEPRAKEQLENLNKIMQWSLNLGISAHFTFTIGFPNETPEDLLSLIQFCKRHTLTIRPAIYTPTPDDPNDFLQAVPALEKQYGNDLQKFLLELGENKPITANLSPWVSIELLGLQQLIEARDEERVKQWLDGRVAVE